jgi:hypothetical protein
LNTWPGSLQDRAHKVHSQAILSKCRPLAALIVAATASRGSSCWETDAVQASQLVQRNGKHPHPKSVARSRKEAAALGVLICRRIFPSQRPKYARYRVSAGTTEKFINWKILGIADPISRGERRKVDLHERSLQRVEARHSAPGAIVPRAAQKIQTGSFQPTVDPQLQRDFDELREHFEGIERAEDDAMLATVPRRGRAPPR